MEKKNNAIIFAHRGAWGKTFTSKYIHENTIQAFEHACLSAADGIELDVFKLKDGTLAIHHDPIIYNESGDEFQLESLSREDITKAKWKTGKITYRIPCLDSITTLAVASQKILNVELKGSDTALCVRQHIVNELLPIDMFVISSFNRDELHALRAYEQEKNLPPVPIALLVTYDTFDMTQLKEDAETLNAVCISVDIETAMSPYAKQLIPYVRQSHRRAGIYTINDADQANYFMERGFTLFFSDHPSHLRPPH